MLPVVPLLHHIGCPFTASKNIFLSGLPGSAIALHGALITSASPSVPEPMPHSLGFCYSNMPLPGVNFYVSFPFQCSKPPQNLILLQLSTFHSSVRFCWITFLLLLSWVTHEAAFSQGTLGDCTKLASPATWEFILGFSKAL